MKKLILMAAAALLMMTQCRKSEVSPVTPGADTIKITVTAGPGRTDITAGGAITWSKGDKLWVSDSKKWLGSLDLVSGAGGGVGVFTGTVTKPEGVTIEDDVTLKFFYLGRDNGAAPEMSTNREVTISFARQNVYADGKGNLVGAGAFHVGMGAAPVTYTGTEISGLDVKLTSMVAIARMEFERLSQPYCGPLDLTGTGICSKMKVTADGGFTGTAGKISLGFGPSERYVFLVPQATPSAVTMKFEGDRGNYIKDEVGETTLGNGIVANMLYQVGDQPITVNVSACEEWVTVGDVDWSRYNLGATLDDQYGDYFQWGSVENVTKAGSDSNVVDVDWPTCPWTKGEYSDSHKNVFIKYVQEGCASEYGYNGFFDNKTVLDAEDDAAQVVTGGLWRIPTTAEIVASFDEYPTPSTKEDFNPWVEDFTYFGIAAVAGIKCSKAPELFVPVAGYRENNLRYSKDIRGRYWAASIGTTKANLAHALTFRNNDDGIAVMETAYSRYYGQSVRPVRCVR